jgi:hypothetical protein
MKYMFFSHNRLNLTHNITVDIVMHWSTTWNFKRNHHQETRHILPMMVVTATT